MTTVVQQKPMYSEDLYKIINNRYGYFTLIKDFDRCGHIPVYVDIATNPEDLFESSEKLTDIDFHNKVNNLNEYVTIFEPYTDEKEEDLRDKLLSRGIDYAMCHIYYPFEPNMFDTYEQFAEWVEKLFAGYRLNYFGLNSDFRVSVHS